LILFTRRWGIAEKILLPSFASSWPCAGLKRVKAYRQCALQIYSECDGRNYAELAKKYNLTLQWIYKIVKRVHTEKQQQRRMQ